MLSLIGRFLASKSITLILLVVLSGGGWFIYSELQDKAVIEKELSDIKASQVVINKADSGLIKAESAIRFKSSKIKIQVDNAITKDSGDISDDSIRRILCRNGLASTAACDNPKPILN